MCGIAGVFGRSEEAAVVRMLDQQRRRGPDGRGVWVSPDGQVVLGHDRLSIIDVAGGAQPIANEDKTLWLVANGEIYNYKQLRAELEGRHTFRTNSDSEVILHLFEEMGTACVTKLDGMFAFALWGPEAGIFLARDPLGIKPLYYGFDSEGALWFASEIKALVGEIPEIQVLPPGAYLAHGNAPTRHYMVPWPESHITDPLGAIDELDETLTNAVVKRLMADVPLGVFLSGGLDSSLIAAIVRKHVTGPLHSFSVGLEGSKDLLNARVVAKAIGTIHHERILNPEEIISVLPSVIGHLESFDPALVRSAVPTYFVSEMAAQLVKVVLSGEGADELFAGYHYLTEFDGNDRELALELRHITCALHSSNLQRVDRMTMAHGLEGRVPFLDTSMLDLAFRMDNALKRREGEGKWVLRKVGERYLPAEICWRVKEKFAIGTGIGPLLEQYAESVVGDLQSPFRSKEEWLYWSLFQERYGRPDVISTMGRSRSLNPGQRWIASVS